MPAPLVSGIPNGVAVAGLCVKYGNSYNQIEFISNAILKSWMTASLNGIKSRRKADTECVHRKLQQQNAQ
jgi:hypothetical protein